MAKLVIDQVVKFNQTEMQQGLHVLFSAHGVPESYIESKYMDCCMCVVFLCGVCVVGVFLVCFSCVLSCMFLCASELRYQFSFTDDFKHSI